MTETLSICIHGIPVKFNSCFLCITKQDMVQSYQSLSNRIDALHEYKLSQIDANRKTGERLDDHEKGLQSHHDELLRIESQVHALVEMYKELSINHVKLIDIEMSEKKPYKCPVCDGSGDFELDSIEAILRNHGSKHILCHSCEGKGVLWG